MGRGYLSIESAEVKQGQKVYVVVFRSLIGKTLFQGTLSALHSKQRRITEKALKLQHKIALMVKDGDKFKVEYCVISFARSEDIKDFESKFDEAIVELKKPK
jgi:hypothetical protein